MSEAATLGVLSDLFAIAGVALAFGLMVYAAIRSSGGPQWNCEGNVLSRPYGVPEGVVALLLAWFFAWQSTASSPQGSGTAAAASSAAPPIAPLLAGMVFMLTIALVLLVFLRVRGLDPAEMFGMRHMPLRSAALWALGSIVVVYLVMTAVNYLVVEHVFGGDLPDGSDQEPVEAFKRAGGFGFRFLLGAAAVVVAPVAEETIFRGFLYGITKRFTDRWFAAILTSLIFACVHRHVGSTVPLFILALGFSVIYEVTGSLVVPMMMHAMFNAWTLLLLSLFTK